MEQPQTPAAMATPAPGTLSIEQRWVLAIGRHIIGCLSMIASSIIVYHVLLRFREQKKKHRRHNTQYNHHDNQFVLFITPYHRIMLGLSLTDILYASAVALNTIMVPVESSDAVYGLGTMLTCSIQGFFIQFLPATILYTASLSVYFLLKIRYNVSDRVVQQRYEIWFHGIPWLIGLGTGTMGLTLQIFNPMPTPELGCWLGPYPKTCFDPNGPPCTRGYKLYDLVEVYAIVMAYLWFFVSFVIIFVNNYLIYRSIRQQEKRNAQYLAARLQYNSTVTSTVLGSCTTTRNGGSNNNMSSSSAMAVPSGLEDAQMEPSMTEAVDDDDDDVPTFHTTTPPAGDHHVESNKAPPKTTTFDERPDGVMEEEKKEPNGCADDDMPIVPIRAPVATQEGMVPDALAVSTASTIKILDDSMAGRRLSVQQPCTRASRIAAYQSFLYIMSAFCTAIWTILPLVAFNFGLSSSWRFFFNFMTSTIVPAQGVINLAIYVRLEYIRLRTTHHNWSRFRCIQSCLFSPDLSDPDLFQRKRRSQGRFSMNSQ